MEDLFIVVISSNLYIFTGFQMSMHSTEAKELPAVSVSKVDFETAAVIAINEDVSRFTMVKVHGK